VVVVVVLVVVVLVVILVVILVVCLTESACHVDNDDYHCYCRDYRNDTGGYTDVYHYNSGNYRSDAGRIRDKCDGNFYDDEND